MLIFFPATNFEVTKEQVDKDLERQVFGPHTGIFTKKVSLGFYLKNLKKKIFQIC